MKVVTLKELLKYPEGTIFSEWTPPASDGLYVFLGEIGDNEKDFVYRSLLPEPASEILAKMETTGFSVSDQLRKIVTHELPPVLSADDDTSSWGLFDRSGGENFVVYEAVDLSRMAIAFTKAYKVAIDNDDHTYKTS